MQILPLRCLCRLLREEQGRDPGQAEEAICQAWEEETISGLQQEEETLNHLRSICGAVAKCQEESEREGDPIHPHQAMGDGQAEIWSLSRNWDGIRHDYVWRQEQTGSID